MLKEYVQWVESQIILTQSSWRERKWKQSQSKTRFKQVLFIGCHTNPNVGEAATELDSCLCCCVAAANSCSVRIRAAWVTSLQRCEVASLQPKLGTGTHAHKHTNAYTYTHKSPIWHRSFFTARFHCWFSSDRVNYIKAALLTGFISSAFAPFSGKI